MRTIGALIFDGFELLDLFGPMEMFGLLPEDFSITVIAETVGPVKSGQGPSAMADASIADGLDYGIVFVPGGPGTRREINNGPVLDWLRAASDRAELTLSVCTGAAILARAGVLDGRTATSNKAAWAWVTSQGPNVDWKAKARWVEDGPVFTSSGVSAGMDMTLAAIARLHGQDRARQVALWCEYDWHRDPDWDPFAQAHGLV